MPATKGSNNGGGGKSPHGSGKGVGSSGSGGNVDGGKGSPNKKAKTNQGKEDFFLILWMKLMKTKQR